MAGILIPIGELILEGLATTGEVVAANAAPAAIATGVVGTGVVVASAVKSNSSTGANTTTVVGSGKMNCGEDGKYGDLLKKSGDNKLDRDHVPSKAALQEAARNIIDEYKIQLSDEQIASLFGKGSNPGLIAKEGETIAIPKSVHQKVSDTYGGRNTQTKIDNDADDLQKAAEKDTKAIEDAEGKDMDAECQEKYKKAAEKIRKKTNAEYEKDILDLIKKVKKSVT